MNSILNFLLGCSLLYSSIAFGQEIYRFVGRHEMIPLPSDLKVVARANSDYPAEALDVIPEYESVEQVHAAFRRVRDDPISDWKRRIPTLAPEVHGGVRAVAIATYLKDLGYPVPAYIYIDGMRFRGCTSWIQECFDYPWHIAPIVRVGGDIFVIDTAYYPDRPLSIEDWLDVFDVDFIKFEIRKHTVLKTDYALLQKQFNEKGAPFKKELELLKKFRLSPSLILDFEGGDTPTHPWHLRGPSEEPKWYESPTEISIDNCEELADDKVSVRMTWKRSGELRGFTRLKVPYFSWEEEVRYSAENHRKRKFHSEKVFPYIVSLGGDRWRFDRNSMAISTNKISISIRVKSLYGCESAKTAIRYWDWIVETTKK